MQVVERATHMTHMLNDRRATQFICGNPSTSSNKNQPNLDHHEMK